MARLSPLCLVLLLATACGSPTPTPSPAAAPTPTPTLTPTPSTTLSPAPRGLPALGAELTPGTYFSNEPGLEVMFTVGAGWVHQQSGVAFFDIERDPGSPDVIAIQFAAVTLDQAQSDLAGQIQASDQLIVSPPEEIELDCHLDATRLVVEPRAPADTDPPTFVPVVSVVAGTLSIATGRRLQLDIFTFHMGGAIIMVGGPVAHWDETLAAAAPVLDSVKLRPDGAVCE